MANQESELAMLRQQLLESHGRPAPLSGCVAQAMGMLQIREPGWRRAAAASINVRAVLLEEAKIQETTLLDHMSQIGHALQRLSTDATTGESQRREQVRIIANLQAYTSNLRSVGTELERQHQLTLQRAEARAQQCCKMPRFSIGPSRNEP